MGATRHITQLEAIEDARRDGEHVLRCTGHFAPHDVGVGVHPEGVGSQELLHFSGEGLVHHGHHGGRGLTESHLPRRFGPVSTPAG